MLQASSVHHHNMIFTGRRFVSQRGSFLDSPIRHRVAPQQDASDFMSARRNVPSIANHAGKRFRHRIRGGFDDGRAGVGKDAAALIGLSQTSVAQMKKKGVRGERERDDAGQHLQARLTDAPAASSPEKSGPLRFLGGSWRMSAIIDKGADFLTGPS